MRLILDLFLGLVTEVVIIGNILLVKKVAFYSCTSHKYDLIAEEVGIDSKKSDEEVLLHPCASLIKLLCQGSFYFSKGTDITRSMQCRGLNPVVSSALGQGDSHFIWNQDFLKDLIRVRCDLLQY